MSSSPNNNTKEKITSNIKSWLQLDKEIQVLQKEIKDRKKKKNEYTNSLLQIMKTNEIDCFDISEGKIMYTQSNVKKPINKTHLLECLNKYFENAPNVATDDIAKFILEHRETSTKENIRHKPSKNI
jgi:hypothetical protein